MWVMRARVSTSFRRNGAVDEEGFQLEAGCDRTGGEVLEAARHAGKRVGNVEMQLMGGEVSGEGEELVRMDADALADGAEHVRFGHIEGGRDEAAGGREMEIQHPGAVLAAALPIPDGADIGFVGRLVLAEAHVAMDAKAGALGRAFERQVAGAKFGGDGVDQGGGGRFDCGFVGGPVGFEPGLVVVGGEVGEEGEGFARVAGEALLGWFGLRPGAHAAAWWGIPFSVSMVSSSPD